MVHARRTIRQLQQDFVCDGTISRVPTPPTPPANASPQSQAAAESIRDAAPTLRAKVYEAICRAGSRGLIRHQIAQATDIDLATVCPRVTELIGMGMIVESGTRPSPKNRPAGVLIATRK